jgi:hypothetical protein
MERECCLAMLILLIGGASLLACGWLPAAHQRPDEARDLERVAWRRLWLPVIPAMAAAAWLSGWAVSESDPVSESVPLAIIILSLPFALISIRALTRSLRSLFVDSEGLATATVGLLQPWVVFSPRLARSLTEHQVDAAIAHERAHARHRDPLRIWLAQLATDLQWPWPQAGERLQQWMLALELARDEEALSAGIDGVDLAEAILASARFAQPETLSLQAALSRNPDALKERVIRLLERAPVDTKRTQRNDRATLIIVPALLLAVFSLGLTFGERYVGALFRIAS